MTDTKLKALWADSTFWILLLISLPGVAAAMLTAWHAVASGTYDPQTFTASIMGLPIVAYLVARQYPRGKAIEAAPHLAGVQSLMTPAESNAAPGEPDSPPETMPGYDVNGADGSAA